MDFHFSPKKYPWKLYICIYVIIEQRINLFHLTISIPNPPKKNIFIMSPCLFHKVHSLRAQQDAFFICRAIHRNDHKRLVMSHNVPLKGINDNLINFTFL